MSTAHPVGHAGRFNVTIRPGRAAYLIASGSRTGFQSAVQEATVRWGGACEPIIEMSEDGAVSEQSQAIIAMADVDALVNIDAPAKQAQALSDSLGMHLVPVADIRAWGTSLFTCHTALLDSPTTVDGSNGYVLAGSNAPLWQVAAAGDLNVDREAEFFGPDIISIRRASFDHEIGEAQLWGHTLLGRTTVSFSEINPQPIPADCPAVIWLTREDALSDCLGLWNLRVLRPLKYATIPMYLLPEDIAHWTTWPRTLEWALRRFGRFAPDVLLTSTTVDESGLDAFAAAMGLHRTTLQELEQPPKPPGQQMHTPPFTYLAGFDVHRLVEFHRSYGESIYVDVPVVRETSTLSFPGPVPAGDGGMALVRITGEPFDILPKHPSVAKLVDNAAVWRDGGIQLHMGLLQDYRIDLAVPSLQAACQTLLEQYTQSHALSAKGVIGAALLDEDGVDALRERNVFEAIGRLTTPRAANLAKKLQSLLGKGQQLTDELRDFVALVGARGERVFSSPAALGHGTVERALAALERLTEVGWAQRGVEITCAGCGITSFVPLPSAVGQGPARCPVCTTAGAYRREPAGLTVSYRLDGRVDHASDQGVMPHLMAIAALRRRYRHTYLMPGVDMVWPDGTKREADVLGICDSRLLTGEMKVSGGQFTEAQIDKDLEIVDQLKADAYLMGATSAIPAASRTYAQQQCAKRGVELLAWELVDLRE